MDFDFDRLVDRSESDSLKWGKYAGRDVLPLWVADMDFVAPPAVLAALRQRLDHGVLGYGKPSAALADTVCRYLATQYGWAVEPDWLVWLPGLVPGLNVACRAIAGDVMTATPIYPPFLSAPRFSGRALVTTPLKQEGSEWRMDFAAMAAAITRETRLYLFCHPHNPVGRAWRQDELQAFADFCVAHDLIVCSDEIHCDLILDVDRPHIPLGAFSPAMAERTITLMAPSKTFNIPGLACAFAVIPDAALRRRFAGEMRGIMPDVNILGFAAAAAAFSDCEDWHQALIAILRRNRDKVEAAVAEMPGLAMTHVEATYLAWIDARGLDVDNPASFFEAAGIGLSNGADFGAPGWVRLNFACPAPILDEALRRMKTAVATRT